MNNWSFTRVSETECVVTDASGQVYCRAHGDFAAHYCQDFIRWTLPPNNPGSQPQQEFGLKPE